LEYSNDNSREKTWEIPYCPKMPPSAPRIEEYPVLSGLLAEPPEVRFGILIPPFNPTNIDWANTLFLARIRLDKHSR
jgi:hypothetical protein